eukprot:Nk52_evm6s2273 gene=Nk52_evmTU6s2273
MEDKANGIEWNEELVGDQLKAASEDITAILEIDKKLRCRPDANVPLRTLGDVQLAIEEEDKVTLLVPGGVAVTTGVVVSMGEKSRTCNFRVDEVKVPNAVVTSWQSCDGAFSSRQVVLRDIPPFTLTVTWTSLTASEEVTYKLLNEAMLNLEQGNVDDPIKLDMYHLADRIDVSYLKDKKKSDWLWKVIRRYVLPPKQLEDNINNLVRKYKDKADEYGNKLLTDQALKDIENMLAHVGTGCVSDPPEPYLSQLHEVVKNDCDIWEDQSDCKCLLLHEVDLDTALAGHLHIQGTLELSPLYIVLVSLVHIPSPRARAYFRYPLRPGR